MNRVIKEINDIFTRRELIRYFVSSDLKVNYKGRMLGFFWMLLDPLFMMLIYVVLVSVIFKRGGPQFPILLLSALISWRWFVESSTHSVSTYLSNRSLIQTNNIPLPVFPISRIILCMISFFAAYVVLVPMLYIFDATINGNLAWFPLVVIAQLLFNIGFSLILSVAGIHFLDLKNIIQFVIKFWFYFSPALYNITAIPPKYYHFYMIINPFAALFESYKNVLVYGKAPNEYMILFAVEAIVFTIVGLLWVNKRRSFIVKNV